MGREQRPLAGLGGLRTISREKSSRASWKRIPRRGLASTDKLGVSHRRTNNVVTLLLSFFLEAIAAQLSKDSFWHFLESPYQAVHISYAPCCPDCRGEDDCWRAPLTPPDCAPISSQNLWGTTCTSVSFQRELGSRQRCALGVQLPTWCGLSQFRRKETAFSTFSNQLSNFLMITFLSKKKKPASF